MACSLPGFDAAQLEKEREDAEQARLEIFATAYTLGRYFLEHVGEDLKRQWEGTQINPETGEEEPYKKRNSFSINQKQKILNWAYDTAVKNAVAKTDALLEIGKKAFEKSAFDEAFSEVLETRPDLHDAYLQLMSIAIEKSRSIGDKKHRGSR